MSQKIDPREVLNYLNELGYTNITAQQLKEFIIDLKKLIKFDSRYKSPEESTISNGYRPDETDYCECSESKEDFSLSKSDSNKENVGLSIPSEKPKVVGENDAKRDRHISLHIYDRSRKRGVLHEHCVHVNDPNANVGSDRLDFITNKTSDPVSIDNTTESTVHSIRPCSARNLQSQSGKFSSKSKKSKVSFIRPLSAKPSFNKCDPVALYHHYQSEWKKTTIPGQDKREELRWAIREKMSNGPKVELKTRPISRRCSSCYR